MVEGPIFCQSVHRQKKCIIHSQKPFKCLVNMNRRASLSIYKFTLPVRNETNINYTTRMILVVKNYQGRRSIYDINQLVSYYFFSVSYVFIA